MQFIFVLGLALAILFSASAACYFVLFRSHIKNTNSTFTKTVATFVVGLVVFALVFMVSLILVWPPYLWNVLE